MVKVQLMPVMKGVIFANRRTNIQNVSLLNYFLFTFKNYWCILIKVRAIFVRRTRRGQPTAFFIRDIAAYSLVYTNFKK